MEKCTAQSKRSGKRCKNWPLKGFKTCKFHGAKGGAKTPQGKQRQKMASWKDGFHSKESLEERRRFRETLKAHKEAINE